MDSRKVTSIPVTEKTVGPQWDDATKIGNWDPSRSPIDTIYIHTMDGTSEGTDATFNNAKSCVSAHYGIKLTGEIWHWVDEDKTAYHAGVYGENQRSIGIEHEDNGNPNDKVRTPEQYSSSAKLVYDICKFYNIPIDRSHIKKHSEAPFQTSCPDGLDIDKIVADALVLSQEAAKVSTATQPPANQTPPPPAGPNMYQGLDLNNEASVKAAVDTWRQVEDGVFVRKADIQPQLPDYSAIAIALGINADATIDQIIGNIKQLKTNFQQQVQATMQANMPAGEKVDGGVKIGVEGQGPAVAPITPTLANIPAHEKAGLMQKVHDFGAELEKLLGLTPQQ